MERWLAIVGYEGLYEASDAGRIRGLPRPGSRGGVLSTDRAAKGGYPCVRLYRNGRSRHLTVHSLVATTFHGPRPPGTECRHLNGDELDCHAANLRWGTSAENSADMVAHGRGSVAIENCPDGHPYDEQNTYRWGGKRYCRACNRPRTRDGQRRRRAARKVARREADDRAVSALHVMGVRTGA